MNNLQLPDDAELSRQIIQNEADHKGRQMEIGVIGKILGGGEEKVGNIAALCLAFCFVLLVFVLWALPAGENTPKYEIVTALISIITLTIGYLFGKK